MPYGGKERYHTLAERAVYHIGASQSLRRYEAFSASAYRAKSREFKRGIYP
jgi:hypothetical protein